MLLLEIKPKSFCKTKKVIVLMTFSVKSPRVFSLSGNFVICAFSHAAEAYLSHRTTVLTEIGP